MLDVAMDDRKQRVLRAIVTLYATEGEPVGSGLLARYFQSAVSSATLRNEMAALTKLGLLEQPHTSAGRIPSTKGYRYYIDNLMGDGAALAKREKAEIDEAFSEMDFDPERLAQSAARALAELSGCAVVATTPQSDDACIAHYEVVQVGQYTAAVLAVTNSGGVHTRTAKLDAPLTPQETRLLTQALNSALAFHSFADITKEMLQRQAKDVSAGENDYYPIFLAAYKLSCESGKSKVFFKGQQNLLGYRETDESIHMLLEFFGNPEAVSETISAKSERTTVLLGDEIPRYPMPGLCIMTKQYHAGGGRTGAIGIVGPTRMPYREFLPKLEYFAALLGQCMSGGRQQEEKREK